MLGTSDMASDQDKPSSHENPLFNLVVKSLNSQGMQTLYGKSHS